MPCGQIDPGWEQGGRTSGSGRGEGGLEPGGGQADQEGHDGVGGEAAHGRVRYGVYGRGGRGGGNTGKALHQVFLSFRTCDHQLG